MTLLDVLAKNYPLPHYAFMREFRNATGFDANRSADALAFGMYRSRGQHIIGFEVKTARSDWLRELKSPAKAEPIARFCDYFYLVIPEPANSITAVAKIEELPAPWGLFHVNVDKLKAKIVKRPDKLDAEPISRSFLCAIVKQAMDSVIAPGTKALQQARDAGYKEGAEEAERTRGDWQKRYENLEQKIEEFEKASGIVGLKWGDGKIIGRAVSAVSKIQAGERNMLWNLESTAVALERSLKQVQEDAAAIRALLPAPTV
jgi:hypothetical protein